MTVSPSRRKAIWFGAAAAGSIALALIAAFALWPFETLSKLAVTAAFLRGGLIILLAWVVFGRNQVDYISRAFLGLAAVAMTMTVQSLLIEKTPYEIWAAILSSAGFLGFFVRLFGFGLWERISLIGSGGFKATGEEPRR